MSNRKSTRSTERVTDADLLGCLSETPIRTGVIAMRLGLPEQRVADRLRQMAGVRRVMFGKQNRWRLES